ncbi:bidirectional hydrogenase complex protein HoxE (plasmid) [Nostoc linckia NIES-25]|nr:bidirectional hydrogenase complex protein HoxE [Nostoc linckia NIES-25]
MDLPELIEMGFSDLHTIQLCTNIVCYAKGAPAILTHLEKFFEINPGETTANNQILLLTTNCLGACEIAPAVAFDGTILGNQTAELVGERIKGWLQDGST